LKEALSANVPAGAAAAKARGVKFGRKRKLTAQQINQARKLIAAGESPSDVADTFKVGRTLYRALTRLKL
jgi:DNA invertase Pin-like site-specific DNA recombinase